MRIIGIQSEVCSHKGHIYDMINKPYGRIWLLLMMLIKMVIIIIIIIINGMKILANNGKMY